MSSPLTPQLIAPYKTGLDTDIAPWLAPPDSFSEIVNMHVHHGSVEKRAGYTIFGSLEPDGATSAITAITNANPGQVTIVGHGYSTNDRVFIAAVGGMTAINDKIFVITKVDNDKFTINADTSGLNPYTAGGTSALCIIADDRVMGITRYVKLSDGTHEIIAFSAKRAHVYNTTTKIFDRLDAGVITMGSGEFDFVWSINWQLGATATRLYYTNGITTTAAALGVDGIRYYDGTATTVEFQPTLSPPSVIAPNIRTLYGGKLLFVIGQRLVVLFTFESTNAAASVSYPTRARWCAKKNPDTTGWDDVTQGRGGFADAGTGEQIISARTLENKLIVFFTNSVWMLFPTADPGRAFRWKKLNDFRACGGKMASIGYDRYVVALGTRGITSTDGTETRRIDSRIEDFSIDEINTDMFQKVFCERDYNNRRWWTLYNDTDRINDENNSSLIYDDESAAFSTYAININCLGYGSFSEDLTWADFSVDQNRDWDFTHFADQDFFEYFNQTGEETLLGGSIYGDIFTMVSSASDNNEPIEAKLVTASWSPTKEEGTETQLNYLDIFVQSNTSTTATIEFFKDTDKYSYSKSTLNFLPDLGFIATVNDATQANPVSMNVPDHGLSTGVEIYIYGVAGMVALNGGPYIITKVNQDNFTLDDLDGTGFSEYTGGGSVFLREFYRTKVWKRVYGGGIGSQHRIRFTSIGNEEPFKIHGMKPYFRKLGRRTIN